MWFIAYQLLGINFGKLRFHRGPSFVESLPLDCDQSEKTHLPCQSAYKGTVELIKQLSQTGIV